MTNNEQRSFHWPAAFRNCGATLLRPIANANGWSGLLLEDVTLIRGD